MSRWSIRRKLLVCLAIVLAIVASLAYCGLSGGYSYKRLAWTIKVRATDLKLAGELTESLGDLRVSLSQSRELFDIFEDYNNLSGRDTLNGNPPTEIVIPANGVVAGVYVQAISAYAPHPNAAKLWMEHLYSDEGQLLWLKGYCHPIRFNDLVANGKVPQELLDALYFHAMTYAHGHSVGGTNPSLLRAMGAGTAVIAYDVPFNREVLAEEAWFFEDERDVAMHFSAVETDAAAVERLGARGRERARSSFRWDDVATAYEGLARRLARGESVHAAARRATRRAEEWDFGATLPTVATA